MASRGSWRAEGCELVTAARNIDQLEEDAKSLRADHGVAVVPRQLDLGDGGSVAAMAEFWPVTASTS